MTEQEFHGPRPATQWDSVPVPELARLRRIEAVARKLLARPLQVRELEMLLDELAIAVTDRIVP